MHATRTIAAALLFGALPSLSHPQPGPAQTPESVTSPTLRRLAEDAGNRSGAASLAAFWSAVRRSGTPLVEPASGPQHRLVSFVFRGGDSVASVRLDSHISMLLARSVRSDPMAFGMLTRVPGTDVWSLTVELPADLRLPYAFQVTRHGAGKAELSLDSLNPRVHAAETRFARSLIELPNAPPQPWRGLPSQGTWTQLSVESAALGGRQTLHIYMPRGYNPDRTRPYRVVLALDPVTFRAPLIPADQIVDFLTQRDRIAETVLVLTPDVGPVGDTRGYDPVVAFLADEALPAVRRAINISSRPEDVVVTGTSRRGLVSAYAAFKRSDAIGHALTLSGSYYWRPPASVEYEWLPHLYATSERRSIRLYVAAGTMETGISDTNRGHYLLGTNRHMRDILAARGYDFTYVEFPGAHTEVNWEDQFAAGLATLGSKR